MSLMDRLMYCGIPFVVKIIDGFCYNCLLVNVVQGMVGFKSQANKLSGQFSNSYCTVGSKNYLNFFLGVLLFLKRHFVHLNLPQFELPFL